MKPMFLPWRSIGAQAARRSIWVGVAAWVVLGVCLIPLDMPIARSVSLDAAPGEVRELLAMAEWFGHAYGALVVLGTILLLDPARRRHAATLLAGSLGAGLVADAIKPIVPRMRPYDFETLDGVQVWDSFLLKAIWDEPHTAWRAIFDAAHHSFPSAHTAVAVGLAIVLARLYPRGRWWFFFWAGMCGLERIHSGAHFPSDVCWGAAVGTLTSQLVLRWAARRSPSAWEDNGRDASDGRSPQAGTVGSIGTPRERSSRRLADSGRQSSEPTAPIEPRRAA